MTNSTAVDVRVDEPARSSDGKSVNQTIVVKQRRFTVKWVRVPHVGTTAPLGVSDPIIAGAGASDDAAEEACRQAAVDYRAKNGALLESLLPARL